MASRILLISINRCVSPDPVVPLGLAHINAALRRAGHETRWLDRLWLAGITSPRGTAQPGYILCGAGTT